MAKNSASYLLLLQNDLIFPIMFSHEIYEDKGEKTLIYLLHLFSYKLGATTNFIIAFSFLRLFFIILCCSN